MATRQNQEQTTKESTEQTDLFTAVENAPDDVSGGESNDRQDDRPTPEEESASTEVAPDSWAAPFSAHDDANLGTLDDPQGVVEAREIVERHGDSETQSKLKSALRGVSLEECISNVRGLMGIHAELNGTRLYNENLADTAQKVLRHLRKYR